MLGLAALAFHDPGYMDAYYAYHVAANLAAGRGFTEDFIWIYLANPPSLSHPSHLYWMPLASLLAYPALLLSGEHFRAAQAPFLLLSVVAVVTTALLARQLLPGTFRPLAAALLTLFAGYYFVYWLAVDAFGAFTLAALLAFVATAGLLEEDRPLSRTVLLSALLGLATAVAHLARADGPLLLAACSLVLIASQRRRAPQTWLLAPRHCGRHLSAGNAPLVSPQLGRERRTPAQRRPADPLPPRVQRYLFLRACPRPPALPRRAGGQLS